jgi:hypothetical protein
MAVLEDVSERNQAVDARENNDRRSVREITNQRMVVRHFCPQQNLDGFARQGRMVCAGG